MNQFQLIFRNFWMLETSPEHCVPACDKLWVSRPPARTAPFPRHWAPSNGLPTACWSPHCACPAGAHRSFSVPFATRPWRRSSVVWCDSTTFCSWSHRNMESKTTFEEASENHFSSHISKNWVLLKKIFFENSSIFRKPKHFCKFTKFQKFLKIFFSAQKLFLKLENP